MLISTCFIVQNISLKSMLLRHLKRGKRKATKLFLRSVDFVSNPLRIKSLLKKWEN
jgi:hypothetical protein